MKSQKKPQTATSTESSMPPLIANTTSIVLKEMGGQVDYLSQLGDNNFLVGSTHGQVCVYSTYT